MCLSPNYSLHEIRNKNLKIYVSQIFVSKGYNNVIRYHGLPFKIEPVKLFDKVALLGGLGFG